MTSDDKFDLARWQRGLTLTLFVGASTITFPNETDSNSPALWELVDGQWTLTLFNSVAGRAELSAGRSVTRLVDLGEVAFVTAPPLGGYWFEAVVRDTDAWYGYDHNELEGFVCAGSGKVLPRIGAARSDDHGRTWTDLGPVIETPPGEEQCDTRNHYFAGGVGDFSALVDADRNYVYFYYSQYAEKADRVGVSVARMAWAARDAPRGRVDIWNGSAWLPPTLAPSVPEAGTDDDDAGDSPHVPRAPNTRLDDPAGWTAPVRLFSGGEWYPQVIGLDEGQGTDAYAGGTSRFFMAGRSDYTIRFGRR